MKRRDKNKRTFDPKKARAEREADMTLALESLGRQELVEVARDIAEEIARKRGGVTADDYSRQMLQEGFDPNDLGPAAGCVFRDKRFKQSGEWRKSERVSNHASDLRIWVLMDAADNAAALEEPPLPPKKDVAR